MERKFRYPLVGRRLSILLLLIVASKFLVAQHSIFQPTDVPLIPLNSDAGPIEVGMKFRATQSGGQLLGLRFYKGAGNTGTHTGHLWSSTGTLLATAVFTNETTSGWQQVMFNTPVAITANTTYVASYHSSDGFYSETNPYFTSTIVNGPLSALADGEDGNNGIYTLSPTAAFPTSNYQTTNYWVDVVLWVPDITAPTISSVSPLNGAMSVSTSPNVSVTFTEPLTASSVTSANFELRNSINAIIPSTVSYIPGSNTVTLTPTLPLGNSSVYTATVKGGTTGIKDTASNSLDSDFSWSFTTAPPPPTNGQGGPILVISVANNPFSRYATEILRAEGLTEFNAMDITAVNTSVLNNYDVVILGEMSVSSSVVTMLTNWVNAGGTLIAFKPNSLLTPLMGLTNASGTLSDKYLLINNINGPGPGTGIVNQTMQYHGAANLHMITGNSGTIALANIYSAASIATNNPAVTMRNVGSNGGRAIAFTYDLAKSIVYTRQGNPAWAGTKRDGAVGPTRSDDLFFGLPANSGVDWVDFSKISIPQADEQQRLLANIILQSNLHRKPLPRFWYLPRGLKAAVVMTGDDHGNNGTVGRFNQYMTLGPNSPQDVLNWTAIRGTSYVDPATPITTAQIAAFEAQGFDIEMHLTTNCTDFTQASLQNTWATELASYYNAYPNVSAPVSNRNHCVAWSDWASAAKVEAQNGVRLDANYYYWSSTWVQNRPGLFTGSGMPMRFADSDGTLIDCYQATTQLTDESGISISNHINQLLDKALGAEGYYGVFTANMHTDTADHTGSNAIIASALARQVPVISARQLLTWLDGRNNSFFGNITWSGNQLSFPVTTYAGANNLQAMLPVYSSNGQLTSITRNGSPIAITQQTIKGILYGFFDISQGTNNYVATYTADNTAPGITNIAVVPNFNGTATVTWNTGEASDSKVIYGKSETDLNQNATDNNIVTSHTTILTGLEAGVVYYFRVLSKDVASNTTTEPLAPTAPLSFVVPPFPCVTDQFGGDFALGTTGSNTIVTLDGDGGIILKPLSVEEFSATSVPAGWSSGNFAGGGATTFGSGCIKVNGTHVYSNTSYGPGTSIEFLASFTSGSFQNVGFSIDQNFSGGGWVTIGEGNPDGNIYARVSDGTAVSLGSNLIGSMHRYRIKWNASNFEFYVDGSTTPVATINFTVTSSMYLQVSDFANNDGILSVDWFRIHPYSMAGTYTSRVFDAGIAKPWGSVIWNVDQPSGTNVTVSVRTGNTAVPDASWSPFTPISTSGMTVGTVARYIQYKADLGTFDNKITPALKDILINCSAPLITTQPVPKAICDGNSVTFTSVATGIPTPVVQWQVSTNGTTWTNISGATSTNLTFTVAPGDNNKQFRAVWTNYGGVINSTAVTLTVKTQPSAPTVSVVNNCGNSELTASGITGSVLWSNGGTSSSITVTNAANYTVTQTLNGCTSTSGSGNSAPKAIPGTPSIIVTNNCGSSLLTASNYTGSLLWSNGATTSTTTVGSSGTYSLTQTINGCASAPATGSASPAVVPSIPRITTVNNCGSSVLTASNYSGTLLWNTGETTPSITVSNPGIYTVSQIINGCESNRIETRGGIAKPKILPTLSSALSATVESGVIFNYTPTSTAFNTTFTWSRDAVTGILNPANNGSGGISEALINTTATTIDVTYAYSLWANDCNNLQNVVVHVTPPPGPRVIAVPPTQPVASRPPSVEFRVSAMPNPSNTYFNLVISAKDRVPVIVRILDLSGRVIEQHEKAGSSTLDVGYRWPAGAYFAEVSQGDQRKIIRIVKTN